ncbi:hypothetical protein GCM10010517_80760 [Streptosporangium fragile]|uniref:Uncharacterized protein n=1 Tax=Streptosporangium fragile TaxID=46186 RepID=A0ABN3WI08_9ACTN
MLLLTLGGFAWRRRRWGAEELMTIECHKRLAAASGKQGFGSICLCKVARLYYMLL